MSTIPDSELQPMVKTLLEQEHGKTPEEADRLIREHWIRVPDSMKWRARTVAMFLAMCENPLYR